MKNYIGLEVNGIKRHILTIEYSSDGSYYIYPPNLGSLKYSLGIIEHGEISGTAIIPFLSNWVTSKRFKLTHHIDGKAQISGNKDIISGFYKLTGKAKGISVNSFNLREKGIDGGIIFSINLWGLNNYPILDKINSIIIKSEEIYPSMSTLVGNQEGFVIETHYLPKKCLTVMFPDTHLIRLSSNGVYYREAKCILPNEASPGFVALTAFESKTKSSYSHGFHLMGVPGYRDVNDKWKAITASYPADHIKGEKNIEITQYSIIKFWIDDKLSKIKSFLLK